MQVEFTSRFNPEISNLLVRTEISLSVWHFLALILLWLEETRYSLTFISPASLFQNHLLIVASTLFQVYQRITFLMENHSSSHQTISAIIFQNKLLIVASTPFQVYQSITFDDKPSFLSPNIPAIITLTFRCSLSMSATENIARLA